MTSDKNLAMVDEIIADLEAVLEKLKRRRVEQQEAGRADKG